MHSKRLAHSRCSAKVGFSPFPLALPFPLVDLMSARKLERRNAGAVPHAGDQMALQVAVSSVFTILSA